MNSEDVKVNNHVIRTLSFFSQVVNVFSCGRMQHSAIGFFVF